MTLASGFVFADDALDGIRWDAKYSTWDTFTGRPVDGYEANRVVVSLALAEALVDAQRRAAEHGFGLLLWDGYRPQRAVDQFVRWADQPEDGRTKRDFYPAIDRAAMLTDGYVATRSGHSRGGAVDLTIFDLHDGALVPMGGRHDLMDERSHHGARAIPGAAARNREVLRSIMTSCGFDAYEREWWHYALTNEPHPSTSFDFPIA